VPHAPGRTVGFLTLTRPRAKPGLFSLPTRGAVGWPDSSQHHGSPAPTDNSNPAQRLRFTSHTWCGFSMYDSGSVNGLVYDGARLRCLGRYRIRAGV